MHRILRQLKADTEKISLNPAEKVELRAHIAAVVATRPVRMSESTRPIGQPGRSSWYHLFTHMNSRTQLVSLAALILVVGSTIIVYERSTGQAPHEAVQLAVAPTENKIINMPAPYEDPKTMATETLTQADHVVGTVANEVQNSTNTDVLVALGTAQSLLSEAHRAYDAGDYPAATSMASNAIGFASAAQNADQNQNVRDAATAPNAGAAAATNPSAGQTPPAPTTAPGSGPNTATMATPPSFARTIEPNSVTIPVTANLSTEELALAANNQITAASTAYSDAKATIELNSVTHAAGYPLLLRAGQHIALAQTDKRNQNYLGSIAEATIAINLAHIAKNAAITAAESYQAPGVTTPPTSVNTAPTSISGSSGSGSSAVPVVTVPNGGPTIPLNTGSLNQGGGTITVTTSSPPLRPIPTPTGSDLKPGVTHP